MSRGTGATTSRKLKVWCPKIHYYQDRDLCGGCIFHSSKVDTRTSVGCTY